MDFALSADQRELTEAAADFARRELNQDLAQRDDASVSRVERLLRSVEGVAYWAAVAPALACLPAAVGYRIACWRGGWDFRYRHAKRTELIRNLRELLGDELSLVTAQGMARECFRFASCEAIDVMRLRFRARPLRRQVEIRGREHLEAALATGKGAIVCSAISGPSTARSRCWAPTASRSPRSGAGSTTTRPGCPPPSGGSGTGSTPGGCAATGTGRTSSRGLAGSRWRRRPLPCCARVRC